MFQKDGILKNLPEGWKIIKSSRKSINLLEGWERMENQKIFQKDGKKKKSSRRMENHKYSSRIENRKIFQKDGIL